MDPPPHVPQRGQPLQLVKVLYEDVDTPRVELSEAHLASLKSRLRAVKADKVAIVSVMGAFRTGKSFLLDLMLRFLRFEARCHAEGINPDSGWTPPERGTAAPEDYHLPPWLSCGGDAIEGSGDQGDGFRFKGGMDACTEGIWVWSEPFVRVVDNERIALLLMDTQGAWDSNMTKEVSATIFGLTTVLSSKEIYNISMQIQEDKVENLLYFMRFAQEAIRRASDSIPSEQLPPEEMRRPFQSLDFLCRDWRHFKKDMTIAQCRSQMREHLARHTDPSRIRENETVIALNNMFHDIGCFCLPHPGFSCQDETWSGSYADLSPDFVRFVDLYIRDVFQAKLEPKKILGNELTPLTFDLVIKEFVKAFKDAAPEAATLTQALSKSTILSAKAKAMKSYSNHMDKVLEAHPRGLIEKDFNIEDAKILRRIAEDFRHTTIFGNAEVRIDTWRQIQESLVTLGKRYREANAQRLDRALAGFAHIAIIAVSFFVLDRISDWTCDWFSQTCVDLSKLMLCAYASFFCYIGFYVYWIFKERGNIAAVRAVSELWNEMARLLAVYSELLQTVSWHEVPDLIKKIATGQLDGDSAAVDSSKSH